MHMKCHKGRRKLNKNKKEKEGKAQNEWEIMCRKTKEN